MIQVTRWGGREYCAEQNMQRIKVNAKWVTAVYQGTPLAILGGQVGINLDRVSKFSITMLLENKHLQSLVYSLL